MSALVDVATALNGELTFGAFLTVCVLWSLVCVLSTLAVGLGIGVGARLGMRPDAGTELVVVAVAVFWLGALLGWVVTGAWWMTDVIA